MGSLSMLSWFNALLPKEERFFDLFEGHAKLQQAGAQALRKLLDGGETVPEYCAEISTREHEADLIARETLLAVRRTFITPFDRSDIRDLITAMDDTIDQMHQTSKATLLYEIRDFDASMRRMGDIIVQSAEATRAAMPLLRAMHQNAAKLNSYSEDITRIEDEADAIHDQGLKDLFRAHRTSDPMAYIVGAEIYGHLESVVDGFEDVANRVTGIVIEHI
jgi:predicted phosphate transport protein (TIGR00153 family)